MRISVYTALSEGFWNIAVSFIFTMTVRKVDVVEAGDQSPEGGEGDVCAALKSMPDSTRLELLGELSSLLQKREG